MYRDPTLPWVLVRVPDFVGEFYSLRFEKEESSVFNEAGEVFSIQEALLHSIRLSKEIREGELAVGVLDLVLRNVE